MNFISRHYQKIMIGVLLLSIVPFFVICFYDRPSADDYTYAIITHNVTAKNGWNIFELIGAAIKTDIEFYTKWQGLYMSAFLQSFQPGIFGEQYYGFGAAVLMIGYFLAIYYFVKTICEIYEVNISKLFATVVLFVLFMQGMPSTVQGIYWYNGAWNYVPGFLLTMVNMAVILRYFHDEDNRRLIVSLILSFLISGGNHVTSFMNILLLVFACFLSLFRKNKKVIVFSLVMALIGFAIMFMAPGTSVRMEETEGIDLVTTIINTYYKFIDNTKLWSDLKWFIYIILLIPFAALIKDSKHIGKLWLHPIFVFLYLCMTICGMMCVPYYSVGTWGSGRIKNMYYFAHILFSGVIWVYLLVYLSRKYKVIDSLLEKVKNKKTTVVVMLLCIAMCIINANVLSIIDDMRSGRAKAYMDSNDIRYEMMREHKGDEVLIFDPLVDCPNLRFDDLGDNLEDWRNDAWYQYYGVKCIVRK